MAGACCANAGPRGPQGPPGDLTVVNGVAAAACPPTSTTRSVDVDVVAAPGSAIIGARLSPCFGQALLAANLDLSASPSGVVQGTGLTVTLPEAGTYELTADVRAAINFQGPGGGGISLTGHLRDETNGGVIVPMSNRALIGAASNIAEVNSNSASVTLHVFYTVTGPTLIHLAGTRTVANGNTLSFTGFSAGATRLAYLKIAD